MAADDAVVRVTHHISTHPLERMNKKKILKSDGTYFLVDVEATASYEDLVVYQPEATRRVMMWWFREDDEIMQAACWEDEFVKEEIC